MKIASRSLKQWVDEDKVALLDVNENALPVVRLENCAINVATDIFVNTYYLTEFDQI